jgi:hypothetical protein
MPQQALERASVRIFGIELVCVIEDFLHNKETKMILNHQRS